MGDGRDYFVPRPRALKAFHTLFVGVELDVVSCDVDDGESSHSSIEVVLRFPSVDGGMQQEVKLPTHRARLSTEQKISTTSYVVEECAALSNCARFDVILVLKELNQQYANDGLPNNHTTSGMHNIIAQSAARYVVAYHLQQQVLSTRSKGSSLLQRTGLASWLDLPDAVDTTKLGSVQIEHVNEIQQLASRLTFMEGAHSISSHLSLIAGGLAPRPNRPDREVIFRPYSSRDAHILLQLKRTVEVVSILNAKDEADTVENQQNNGGRGRIKTLLDGALSAGKAARNEDIVPAIRQLKEYGSDGTPPIGLAQVVAEAAVALAVKPAVASSVARLTAMETSDQISQLRQRVNGVVTSLLEDESTSQREGEKGNAKKSLQKLANELLHEPTMQLRGGQLPEKDLDAIVQCIQMQLVENNRH